MILRHPRKSSHLMAIYVVNLIGVGYAIYVIVPSAEKSAKHLGRGIRSGREN